MTRLRFAAGIFVSAMLLFTVQPMAARLIVPLLGGAPAVWIVCSLCFQALLLAGYAYAHVLGSRVRVRTQVVVHLVLVALALLALPITVDEHTSRHLVETHPTLGVIVVVLRTVGVPFFVLSTTSPLLQRWFAEHGERDPYHLYVASNAGSILALLGYPFVVEPLLGTSAQARAFQVGYLVFAAILVVCAAAAVKHRKATPIEETPPPPPVSEAPKSSLLLPSARWQQRIVWIALAFVPSSLLLGATEYVTTDVASIPLLWLLPLALYLVSFIVAFAEKQRVKPEIVGRAVALLAPIVLFAIFGNIDTPVGAVTALHLVYLFAAAVLCHQALASLRPSVARLTEFYLLLSVGGALGGLWNGIVAPALFDETREYPLAVLLALFARYWVTPAEERKQVTKVDVALIVVAALVGAVVFRVVVPESSGLCFAVAGALFFVMFTRSQRPLAYALALVVLHLAIGVRVRERTASLWAQRSFFGVLRVNESATLRTLAHGRTVHGVQATDPAKRAIPYAYYHPAGPCGDVLGPLPALDPAALTMPPRRVAVIGLGVGALSAYARKGDTWTFFDINPDVVEVARKYFTFLSQAEERARVEVEVGDARLRIADGPADRFDVVVLDAFTSDAIPVHLLTREAFAVYRRALAKDGVLLVHVSNRHLELAPVLAAIAEDAGLLLAYRADLAAERRGELERSESQWAVLTSNAAEKARLVGLKTGWKDVARPPGQKLWTDDYANLLAAMHF